MVRLAATWGLSIHLSFHMGIANTKVIHFGMVVVANSTFIVRLVFSHRIEPNFVTRKLGAINV